MSSTEEANEDLPKARASSPWRRAVHADLPLIAAYLARDEARKVGISGRLSRLEAGRMLLKLPNPLRGSLWLCCEDLSVGLREIRGLLLCHPSRLAIPLLPALSDPASDKSLALLSSSFSPASCLGLPRDIRRFEKARGLEALASVNYRLMRRPSSGSALALPTAGGRIQFRKAQLSDLSDLLPLQEAYEREEVLTPIHSFNQAACEASLKRGLQQQLIYIAVEDGKPIAKAGTNARGFSLDQLGGVFTLPSRRGRGVARSLATLLLAQLDQEGRGSSLFVKPENLPALALYRGLGFEEIDDFRADYFEN